MILEEVRLHAENKRTDKASSDRLATVLLYVAFVMTGLGVVLPGTLLSMLFARWHMDDGRAGILFLLFSVGTSVGALLARGQLIRVLTAGCLLVGASSVGMSMEWHHAPMALIALYGCGLGMAMTSVSLLQSRRRSGQRAQEMARLNLFWALGACTGPFFLLGSASRWGIAAVLQGVAIFFVGLALSAAFLVAGVSAGSESPSGRLQHVRFLPFALLLLIPLATGIESGVGGWLSTYASRTGDSLRLVISATTAFWVGLVLSRLYHSTRHAAKNSAKIILHLHPWLIVAGLTLLIASAGGTISVVAALLIGLGVGPLYPLALALLLDRSETGNVGFLLAGGGASSLPMITGLVSGRTHSLRAGLGVLLLSSALAGALGLILVRGLKESQRRH